VITEAVETREAFAVRRVAWALRSLYQEGKPVTRNRLVERAQVWYVEAWPQVAQALDAALDEARRREQIAALDGNAVPRGRRGEGVP
jgi:hypothetical protein